MNDSFVKTVRAYESIGSTSDEARALAADAGLALPLLVTTNTQTAGRGQGERKWWSDSGSLTFSIVFDPVALGLRREHESRIALTAAVAIIRACSSIASLGIRWPNDVEHRGKKLAGLLPERFVTPHGPRFILGVGLNVTTNMELAPDEVRSMATSLSELTVKPPDKLLILSSVLNQLSEALERLADDDSELAKSWSDLDLLRGQPVRLKLGSDLIIGTGAGIAPDGSLILRTESGDRSFHAGQVLRSGAV